jgi:hypothetical protein
MKNRDSKEETGTHRSGNKLASDANNPVLVSHNEDWRRSGRFPNIAADLIYI